MSLSDSSSAVTGSAKVLLVDDNAALLARAASVLKTRCTVVATVRDARAALEAAAALEPDVIVMDISLPGTTGFELAAQLRASGSRAAIVFFSAYEEEELIAAASDAGGLGYVVKRHLGVDLEPAVREAFAGRRFTSPSR